MKKNSKRFDYSQNIFSAKKISVISNGKIIGFCCSIAFEEEDFMSLQPSITLKEFEPLDQTPIYPIKTELKIDRANNELKSAINLLECGAITPNEYDSKVDEIRAKLGLNNIKEKPPLGIKPKYVFLEQRQIEIIDAIDRFHDANKPVPKEWVEELKDISRQLINSRKLYNGT